MDNAWCRLAHSSANRNMNEDDLKLELIAAIELFVVGITPIEVTEDFISTFLEATKPIQLPKEERLRQLAIAIEHEEIVDGWKGLLKIYKAALQENSTDVKVFHSIAISALEWCEDWRESDLSKRKLATADGKDAVTKGLKNFPNDGDLSLVMGLLNYNEHYESEAEKNLKTETAYQWFCCAVENNAKESARLHRAHCLHDLHRWEEAIVAYESVDQKKLAEQLAVWRVFKLKEQIAYCYAKAGQREKSISLFHHFIDEVSVLKFEENSPTDYIVNLYDLVEAVMNILHDEELLISTRELVEKLNDECMYVRMYENELSLIQETLQCHD